MADYTKGDWKVDSCDGFHDVVTEKRGTIAEVVSHSANEDLANANLIAAAPDMYEALKELVNGIPVDFDSEWNLATLRQARKALSKAEGTKQD